MKTIINFWGGEGALTAYALTIMEFMGIFDESQSISMRLIDFSERDMELIKIYNKYFNIVFEKKPVIDFENIILSSDGSVLDRYHDNEILSLGLSQNDIHADIKNSIYGKKWIGEICFSIDDIEKLNQNLPRNEEFILINCGSYCGEALASVFIPIESSVPISGKRYNVISGPSVKPVSDVKIPYPDIYSAESGAGKFLNIFSIPKLIKIMEEEEQKKKEDIFNTDSDFIEKNQKNIEYLKNKYKDILSDEYDISGLNPDFYMLQFLNSVCTEISSVSATFINMKTNGKQILPYDKNSDIKNNRLHNQKMDITSFINAFSIIEIISDYKKYDDGKIYSFGSCSADTYSPDVLLNKHQRKCFLKFMIMSAVVSGYIYGCFSPDNDIDSLVITEKWAKKKSAFFNINIFSSREKIMKTYYENNENIKFADMIRKNIQSFISEYICSVIKMFMEIDSVSEQSCILSDNLHAISEKIIGFSSITSSQNETENNLKYIIKDIYCIPAEDMSKVSDKVSDFFDDYKKNFPSYTQWQGKSEEASEYFKKIIFYTMQKAEILAGRF